LLKPWVLFSKDKPNYSLAVAQLVSSGAQIQPPLTQGKMIEKGGGRGIFFFFWFMRVLGSGQSVLIWTDPEHRESKETVLCTLGWK